MDYNSLVANKIKEIRLERQISAEAVAMFLKKSKSAYSQLENGKTEISIQTIKNLSDYYKIPIFQIIPDSASVIQIAQANGNNINSVVHFTNNQMDEKTTSCLINAINILQDLLKSKN